MNFINLFTTGAMVLNLASNGAMASDFEPTATALDSDQYVYFFHQRISARGTGAFSENAKGVREVAYARELSHFNDNCRNEVSKAGWKHHVKEARKPQTYLDETNKIWISSDSGYLYCYGITF